MSGLFGFQCYCTLDIIINPLMLSERTCPNKMTYANNAVGPKFETTDVDSRATKMFRVTVGDLRAKRPPESLQHCLNSLVMCFYWCVTVVELKVPSAEFFFNDYNLKIQHNLSNVWQHVTHYSSENCSSLRWFHPSISVLWRGPPQCLLGLKSEVLSVVISTYKMWNVKQFTVLGMSHTQYYVQSV